MPEYYSRWCWFCFSWFHETHRFAFILCRNSSCTALVCHLKAWGVFTKL